MSSTSPIDVAVNPNNTAQRYILWGNGRIDAVGGAPPVSGQATWYDWIVHPVVVALHISNWSTGAGYMLDLYGAVHPFNGAPVVGDDGILQGVPYTNPVRRYVDWVWNPNGNGQGYILDLMGQIYPFGGAAALSRQGPRWPVPVARKLVGTWNPGVKLATLDYTGGVHAEPGTTIAPGGPHWGGADNARDLVVTNWSTGQGYVLDLFGGVWPFGGAPEAHGNPYNQSGDLARCLAVLSPADPIRFWQVWSGGQQFEWISSSPPTVTAGGVLSVSPPSTTTTTTRPTLAWAYSDPQSDSQAEWQVMLFTQTFVTGHNMTDPAAWSSDALAVLAGTNRTTRGVVAPIDLGNGSYRFYVRARDTAGQWSAWANRGWTQSVPLPATPTGISAEPNTDPAKFQIQLAVNTSGTAGDLVRFEFSDDGGSSWATVRGAGAIPRATTTLGADLDAPLGHTRMYRAVAYSLEPRTASAPSAATTARLDRYTYVLTSIADPSLGGEVHAVDPSEWTRSAEAGVFQGIGADYPTVISDGAPKARRLTLHINTQDRGQWETVEALAESDSTLVYRDAFGEVVYCKLVGEWARRQIAAAALPSESTPLRHMHATPLPLVEVAPPVS